MPETDLKDALASLQAAAAVLSAKVDEALPDAEPSVTEPSPLSVAAATVVASVEEIRRKAEVVTSSVNYQAELAALEAALDKVNVLLASATPELQELVTIEHPGFAAAKPARA